MQPWLEQNHKISRSSFVVRRWPKSLLSQTLADGRKLNLALPTTNDERRFSYQTKTLSQINSSYFRIASQFVRRSVPENFAFVDDVCPIRHRQRLSYIVVRNQHSDTAGFHVADYFLQIEYRNGINSRKRL